MRPQFAIKAVALFCTLWCAGTAVARAQELAPLNARLRAHVPNYSVSAPDFPSALLGAAGKFKLPMGIVWIDTPSARMPVELSWKKASVREIIEGIARTQPGYAMAIKGDILHVFPARAVPDRQDFLLLRVKKFAIRDELVQVASRQLGDIAVRIVSPPPPSQPGARGGIIGSAMSTIEYPKVSLDVSNDTIEEILDALAVGSPRKIWIVTFEDDSKLTPTGFRRTRSLWNKNPIANQYQPVWDMFHWGDKIPNP